MPTLENDQIYQAIPEIKGLDFDPDGLEHLQSIAAFINQQRGFDEDGTDLVTFFYEEDEHGHFQGVTVDLTDLHDGSQSSYCILTTFGENDRPLPHQVVLAATRILIETGILTPDWTSMINDRLEEDNPNHTPRNQPYQKGRLELPPIPKSVAHYGIYIPFVNLPGADVNPATDAHLAYTALEELADYLDGQKVKYQLLRHPDKPTSLRLVVAAQGILEEQTYEILSLPKDTPQQVRGNLLDVLVTIGLISENLANQVTTALQPAQTARIVQPPPAQKQEIPVKPPIVRSEYKTIRVPWPQANNKGLHLTLPITIMENTSNGRVVSYSVTWKPADKYLIKIQDYQNIHTQLDPGELGFIPINITTDQSTVFWTINAVADRTPEQIVASFERYFSEFLKCI